MTTVPPASRRRARLALLLAVLALGATVAARPPDSPPLYDGIGFPDEPYRWVTPPQGQTATPQQPTVAAARVPVTDGRSAAARGYSAEQGPQAAFSFPDGAFTAPVEVRDLQAALSPQAPPGPALPGTTIVSNLYRFEVTTDGAAVPLAAGGAVVVNLRADLQTARPVVLCQWDGAGWRQVDTRQVGTEIYAAQLSSLDPIALLRFETGATPTVVAPSGAPPAGAGAAPSAPAAETPTAPGGTGLPSLALIIGGVVILLGAGLVVLRSRTGDDGEGEGEGDGDNGDGGPSPGRS